MTETNEADYYDTIREALIEKFQTRVDDTYLQVTASGSYPDPIHEKVPSGRELIFEFFNRGSSPDLTGFVEKEHGVDFIVVEVKPDSLTNLKPVYQLLRYSDMFTATHGFLITPDPIPTRIQRLCNMTNVLLHPPRLSHLTLGVCDGDSGEFTDWFRGNPFVEDRYWPE